MEFFGNKIKILFILASIGLTISIISFSYAFFMGQVNNDIISVNSVTTGIMEVDYIDGQIIGTTTNMIPGQSVTKTFSIKNTGNVASSYNIYLNDVVNTFVDKNDLVYTLTSVGGGTSIAQSVAPSINTKIASDIFLDVGSTHTYTFTLTFLETNDNQDDNKGATFSTKIDLIEKQVQTVISEPYVYATRFNGSFGRITQKSEGETTIPTTVYNIFNDTVDPNNNYLRYTLVNDEIDTSLVPETCVYYEELGELCLKNNDYENSLSNLFDYINFDKDVWTHTNDEYGEYYSTANEIMNAYCTVRDGTNYWCRFTMPEIAGSEIYVGTDGTVSTLSYYLNQSCSVNSDNTYSCDLVT